MALPKRTPPSVWTGQVTPPRSAPLEAAAPGASPGAPSNPGPADSGSAPDRRPWHHEHPLLFAILVSAVAVAAVLAFMLLPSNSDDEGPASFSRDCQLWWDCSGGAPVELTFVEYRTYLDLNVRPTIIALSASFVGAGCEALAIDPSDNAEAAQESMLEPLRQARDTAREALKQARSIVPPPTLSGFHDRFQGVLDNTVVAVDAVEECAGGSQSGCDDAQDSVGRLMVETAGLAQEAKAIVRL